MPQKSYYHFWYESYSEKKSEITFWEFIELLRRYNIPTLAFDLYQAYAHFFSDHPTEKECRLTAETQDFMEAIQSDGYPSFFERSNATQRLQDAAWKMLSPDISKSQFDTYWRNAMERPMILRIPEDDQLNTRNLFGRVHNICCDFHQQLTQT